MYLIVKNEYGRYLLLRGEFIVDSSDNRSKVESTLRTLEDLGLKKLSNRVRTATWEE